MTSVGDTHSVGISELSVNKEFNLVTKHAMQ